MTADVTCVDGRCKILCVVAAAMAAVATDVLREWCLSTTVIRKACAQFPGFVLLAVTPPWRTPAHPLDVRLRVPKNVFFSKYVESLVRIFRM